MVRINTYLILHEALTRSIGLPRYKKIMDNVDPSNPEFQTMFKDYYKVRRNDNWRKQYYQIFINAKKDPKTYTFEKILSDLFNIEKKVEASFSSKMLATIDPSKPIWDNRVLENLGLKLEGEGDERRKNAIDLYSKIENWYDKYLNSPEGKENIRVFDLMLPDYAAISNIKKIDCLLWAHRE